MYSTDDEKFYKLESSLFPKKNTLDKDQTCEFITWILTSDWYKSRASSVPTYVVWDQDNSCRYGSMSYSSYDSFVRTPDDCVIVPRKDELFIQVLLFPDWGRNPYSILHEVSHHMINNLNHKFYKISSKKVSYSKDHGSLFIRILGDLLGEFMSLEVKRIFLEKMEVLMR